MDCSEHLVASATLWVKKNSFLFQHSMAYHPMSDDLSGKLGQDILTLYCYSHPEDGDDYPEMPLSSSASNVLVSHDMCKQWGSLAPPTILALLFIPLESIKGMLTRKQIQLIGWGKRECSKSKGVQVNRKENTFSKFC